MIKVDLFSELVLHVEVAFNIDVTSSLSENGTPHLMKNQMNSEKTFSDDLSKYALVIPKFYRV